MKIAILIFDKLTALDAIGPYEVLSRIPGAELRFVAKQPGMHRTDTGCARDQRRPGARRAPRPRHRAGPGGGEGNRALIEDEEVLDWLRTAHETTTMDDLGLHGSLVLGAAGILDGKRATSHWAYREELRQYGAEPVAERVVVDGKVVTAAGVSAGIDMALRLVALEYGEDWSRRGSSSGSSTTRSRRSTPARPRRPTRSWSSSCARSPRARGSRAPG